MARFRLKRARTVREVLEAVGMPPETIDEAEASGTAELLAIDAVVLPGKAKLTIDDLAAKVGVEADVVRSLWRALGFVDSDDERSFSKHDVAILKSLVALTQDGLVDPEIALQVARVIGMSLANVATAVVDAGAARSVERRDAAASADNGDEAADDPSARGQRRGVTAVHVGGHRLLVPAALALLLAGVLLASSPGGETQVIGFADLVRFTELSLHLDDRKLADLVGRFDSLVHDVVVRHDGRIVKMIGDAAMFSVLDPAQGALIALELADAVEHDPILSGLRIGMASGPILARDGDLYGPVVNMASRLAAIGRAGAVNVDQSLRDELAGDRRFTLRSLGQRNLRHIGEVRVYRLRPGPLGRHPAAYSEQ